MPTWSCAAFYFNTASSKDPTWCLWLITEAWKIWKVINSVSKCTLLWFGEQLRFSFIWHGFNDIRSVFPRWGNGCSDLVGVSGNSPKCSVNVPPWKWHPAQWHMLPLKCRNDSRACNMARVEISWESLFFRRSTLQFQTMGTSADQTRCSFLRIRRKKKRTGPPFTKIPEDMCGGINLQSQITAGAKVLFTPRTSQQFARNYDVVLFLCL